MVGKTQIPTEKFDISNGNSSEMVEKTRIPSEKFDISDGNGREYSDSIGKIWN